MWVDGQGLPYHVGLRISDKDEKVDLPDNHTVRKREAEYLFNESDTSKNALSTKT
jgi:hypothetical protein